MEKRKAWLVVVALAAAVPGVAHAQESNVALYAGYRFGGKLTDVNTGNSWDLTEGSSYALAADFALSRNTQWELFVSHRSGGLKSSGLFAPAVNDIGLDVTYYQVGGTYFPEAVGSGFYAVGGLGLAYLSPQETGLNAETRFAFNIGGGYLIPVTKQLALKVEARGFVTLLDSSGGMFCSGGCVVQVKGTTLTQAEILAGIAARF